MTPTESGTVTGRLVASFGGILLGGAWWLLDIGAELPFELSAVDLLLFAVAAAAMELLPIRLPDGRSVPSSLAVVGAAAILGAAPVLVALIAAIGWALAQVLRRQDAWLGDLALRTIGGWGLAGIAAIGVEFGPATWLGSSDVGAVARLNVGAAVAVTAAIIIGMPALEVLARTRRAWRHALLRIAEAIRTNAPVGASVASTAALGALVHPVLGAWTLPTMLIPLLAARVGLERLALGQRAYDETIRAMSRLPEQLGTIEHDHGVRVGDLARDVAMELGLDATAVGQVVRAAHLHELGRIQLEREAPAGQRELAVAGADVLRQVGDLDRVAAIVEYHGDLTAVRHDEADTGLSARIVAACCTLDRYAPDPAAAEQRHEVVVRLVREIGDLDVVRALDQVVERRATDVLDAGP